MVVYEPLPFYIQGVGAGADAVQYSLPLLDVERIAEILMEFPAGTLFNLQYRFFLVAGAGSKTTGLPGGLELTRTRINQGIFVGDNVIYTIPFQKKLTDEARVLAFYANNIGNFSLNAAATAILEVSE